ncbi:MAG: alpha/beta fold hydrolase [Thermomicrobiales bacterium]
MPYATNDGVRIYYEREGSGPPILVAGPGFSLSFRDMRDWGQLDALKDGYELILMDARGHGASDKPHDPAAYTFDKRVADVVAVLDDAGIERAVYWGYSMCGIIGYAAAQYASERFRAFIIGGATPYPGDPETGRRWAEDLRSGEKTAVVDSWADRGWAIPEPHRSRMLANDAEALAACMIAVGERPSFAEALGSLRVPMLMYAGDKDQPTHDRAQQATAGNPWATFVSLRGANHANPPRDAVAQHIRAFLADVETTASGVA